MGKNFKVRYQDLDQLDQLFTRQKGHMTKIQTYVTDNCRASGAFEGPVLGLLSDHYSGAYDAGTKGFGNGSTIAEACATKITETKTSLVNEERRNVREYNKKAKESGAKTKSYTEPDTVPLGPPLESGKPASQAGEGTSAYDTVMDINTVANDAVKYGTKTATTLGDPLGVTQGDDPRRWGDYIDPKYWFDEAKKRGVDAVLDHGRGTTLPDGTHIPQSELNAAHRRHLLETYDRNASNGADTAHRHLDTDTGPERTRTPGSIWDDDTGRRVHRTANNLTNTVSAPGEVVSSFKNVVDAGRDYNDARDLHHDVTQAANGPSNDGSITWAEKGEGW